MATVTINDAILLADGVAGVDGDSQGKVYSFDEGDFAAVLDGLVFETDNEFGAVPLGSTVVIDGTTYELQEVWDFWTEVETINLETNETALIQGQALGLTLVDADGNTISFIVPADSLTDPDAGWTGDPINSMTVFSAPYEDNAIQAFDGEVKVGVDDDVEIPCFTTGTMIDTANGRVRVEDLRIGDLVLTRDNGFMPLVWVGQRDVAAAEIAQRSDFAPVLIRQGALGKNLPDADMLVSPQHRMLLCGPQAELLFGEREVLAAAVDLVGMPGIERAQTPVTYVHIMFDSHEIVRADGAWSESFQPAQGTINGLDAAQRDELLALFPQLAKDTGRKSFKAARMILKPHEARALCAA